MVGELRHFAPVSQGGSERRHGKQACSAHPGREATDETPTFWQETLPGGLTSQQPHRGPTELSAQRALDEHVQCEAQKQNLCLGAILRVGYVFSKVQAIPQ